MMLDADDTSAVGTLWRNMKTDKSGQVSRQTWIPPPGVQESNRAVRRKGPSKHLLSPSIYRQDVAAQRLATTKVQLLTCASNSFLLNANA